MLSNPTTLHQRQRQHRRQQSTPTAFDAPKVPNLRTIQRNGSHRRGMSLDQRRQRQSPPQDTNPVSNTNQGFNDNKQQILREAQQQRLARPGQLQQVPSYTQTNDENYLISPLVSPQRQSFDTGCLNSYDDPQEPQSPYQYPGQINTTNRVNLNDCSSSNQFMGNDSILFPGSGNVTPSAYLDFSMSFDTSSSQQDWGATIKPNARSHGRRVSGGIADRVAQFEGMVANQPGSRPMTPPNQNVSNYFPLTPATTPYNRGLKIEVMPQRFSDSYDTSMEETLKPNRRRSPQRAQAIFQEIRDHAQLNQPPSPPGSAPLSSSARFDDSARMPPSTANFMNMSNMNMEFVSHDGLQSDFKREGGYESSGYSPATSNLSPDMSQQSSPEVSHASLFADPFDNRPQLNPSQAPYYLPQSQHTADMNQQMSPTHASYHQRSESVDSINLDESITDTGITIDDIANYISGPDPIDQKWLCLFPECKKRFGRKENIKSHVQTHLGDRQFQCPHCKKCFVRQHDLKRHAKIHSGIKPYPCLCGNSFARHDALTRHRQRGMCIGAFEGVVKKVVKRGRPRKARPDNEERVEKSSKTRNKNRDKAMSSASSTSGYSESSYGHSPPGDDDVLDEKPFGDFVPGMQEYVQMSGNSFQYSSAESPVPADCVSPQVIQNAASPSALSSRSHYSHASPSQQSHRGSVVSIADLHNLGISLPSHPSSPAKSIASQYNTPPELCLSSSSPIPNSQYYDQNQNDEMDLSKLAQLQGNDLSDQDDDMFLEAFGSSTEMGISRLEHDPDMLLMGGKFDEAFGVVNDNDDVFRNCEDVFFGSP